MRDGQGYQLFGEIALKNLLFHFLFASCVLKDIQSRFRRSMIGVLRASSLLKVDDRCSSCVPASEGRR